MSSSHRAPDGSPFRRYFRSASPSGGTQWDPVGPRLHEVPWIERLAAAALALLLVVLCVLVVRPFLSAALWAVVLCTSTWGLFQRLGQSMGNRRSLTALLMTLALTVAIVGPFALVGFSLVEQVRDTAAVIKQAIGTDPFSLTPLAEQGADNRSAAGRVLPQLSGRRNQSHRTT